jgi:hypothetical protein
MLEVIPNTIARKYGIELKGTASIYSDGRTIKVVWNVGDTSSFTFYSNGNWNIEKESGEYIEGHTTPPTQKSWVNRIAKIYWPEYAHAAWWEWVALKSRT